MDRTTITISKENLKWINKLKNDNDLKTLNQALELLKNDFEKEK